jgi:hypothetical protein
MIAFSYRRESDYSIVETSETQDDLAMPPPPTSASQAGRRTGQ